MCEYDVCVWAHRDICMEGKKTDNFMEKTLFFHFYVGSKTQTQLARGFCSKCLYPLSHLFSPAFNALIVLACVKILHMTHQIMVLEL